MIINSFWRRPAAVVPRVSLLVVAGLLTPQLVSSQTHLIGWQTFKNGTVGNNNSGVQDDTPDTNSSYDATPVGSNDGGNLYLSGSIGANASADGFRGLGQATNNDFLNGNTFGAGVGGNGELITDWLLADGSAGTRIGPFGNAAPNGEENRGTSSWKFANNGTLTNGNQVKGDFSITNHSDYYFRLEFIHFDARALGSDTGSNQLDLVYLAEEGELILLKTGIELEDLTNFYTSMWTERETKNISQSVGGIVQAQAYIAPGQSAAFRFLWTGETAGGQSQIDNIAFQGTFFETAELTTVIDPTAGGATSDIPAITAIDYSAADNQVTLTWDSSPGESYTIRYSRDLIDWGGDLDDSVSADPDGDDTTKSYNLAPYGLTGADRVFFRVDKE